MQGLWELLFDSRERERRKESIIERAQVSFICRSSIKVHRTLPGMQSINNTLHAGYDYGSWVRDFSTRFVEAQPNTRIAQFYPNQGRELKNTLQERFIASKSIVLPTLDSERYNMPRRSAETV